MLGSVLYLLSVALCLSLIDYNYFFFFFSFSFLISTLIKKKRCQYSVQCTVYSVHIAFFFFFY